MLAARLGAWLRNTGEKWARTSFAEKLALLLALLAVIYTVVTGAAELRYQAHAREALAQIKAARLAAGAVSAQCYSTGRTFADQTTADGFADGVAHCPAACAFCRWRTTATPCSGCSIRKTASSPSMTLPRATVSSARRTACIT